MLGSFKRDNPIVGYKFDCRLIFLVETNGLLCSICFE